MRAHRALKFPYKIYKTFPCPIVPIQLQGSKGWLTFDAYVDSGAFYSIFSIQDAQLMGLDFRAGRRSSITVGDGNTIPVYFHTLPMKIGTISFNAIIGFSEKLGVGFNLLGRRSVFEKFILVFDDKKRQTTFIPR
jgi:hypothetical protein